MTAAEAEIGSIVIEFVLVDFGDLCAPALVVRMAGAASAVFKMAVNARFGLDICRRILVAIETQLGLASLVEALVTLLALLFVLFMAGNDGAGH
jgi:hypothetical protein